MKVLRLIFVVLFLPWIIVCGMVASFIKCAIGLLTGNFLKACQFTKYLWWAVFFDLRLFVHSGRILIFTQ